MKHLRQKNPQVTGPICVHGTSIHIFSASFLNLRKCLKHRRKIKKHIKDKETNKRMLLEGKRLNRERIIRRKVLLISSERQYIAFMKQEQMI